MTTLTPFALLAMTGVAMASPTTVHHQSRLTDAFGAPINASVDVTFELWTDASGGANPFTETLSVTPVDGFISVDLGAGTVELDTDMLAGAYLQVLVDSTPMGGRTLLGSVPAAAHAQRSAGVDASSSLPACSSDEAGALHFDTANDRLMVCAAGGGWLPVSTTETITTSVTYTIGASGADFTDLQAAFNHLQNVRITTGGFVTLQIQPGTYTHTSTIDVGHVDGARIQIEGDPSAPETVVLQFNGNTNGLFLDTNYHLHRMDGFTLRGDGVQSNRGIQVVGSLDRLGPEVRIENFVGIALYVFQGTIAGGSVHVVGVPSATSSTGLAAYYGSSVSLGGSTFTGFGNDGIVLSGSTAVMAGTQVSNVTNTGLEIRNNSRFLGNDVSVTSTGGTGVLVGESSYFASSRLQVNANNAPGVDCIAVTENGTLEAADSTIQNCGGKGIIVNYNAFANINDSTITNTSESACAAHYRGLLRCQAVTFNSIDNYAGEAIEGGMLLITDPTGTGDAGFTSDPLAANTERGDGAIFIQ